MRCLFQCWFLKKKVFGEKQWSVLPRWLHPVCNEAKAYFSFYDPKMRSTKLFSENFNHGLTA